MPELLSPEYRKRLLGFIEDRFGIGPDAFESHLVFAFKRQAFLFRKQKEGLLEFPESSFVRCGLPFMRLVAGYLKPTTVFLQRFGLLASKNIIHLEMDQVRMLCTNGEISIESLHAEESSLEAPGYVVIKTEGYVLGAGLLLEDSRLLCRFPKSMKQALARISS